MTADSTLPRLRVEALASPQVATISFQLAAGRCLALRGPSGAGKTRLLRLLADLDPGQGEAYLDGVARSSMPAPAWRAQVLYQSAEPAWWANHVLAHIAPAAQPLAEQMATALGLDAARLRADIAQLSTGERQRAALLRSLVLAPKVLLLDEPTSALDPDNTLRVEALLQQHMAQGMALLLVTHSEQQAGRLADDILHLQRRA